MGRRRVNPLILDIKFPGTVCILLLGKYDPNDFGQPDVSPLGAAASVMDIASVNLLLYFHTDPNRAARCRSAFIYCCRPWRYYFCVYAGSCSSRPTYGRDPINTFVISEKPQEVAANPRHRSSIEWKNMTMFTKAAPEDRKAQIYPTYIQGDQGLFEANLTYNERKAFEEIWVENIRNCLVAEIMASKLKASGKEFNPKAFEGAQGFRPEGMGTMDRPRRYNENSQGRGSDHS